MSINKTLPLFITLFIYLIPAQVNAQAQDFTLAANGVTVTCDAANVGDTGDVTIDGTNITFTKRDRAGLDGLISADENNPELATTCTSGITDMSDMFRAADTFNQDIGSWDVSKVMDMSGMFFGSISFNQDIGGWDVSNVTDMTDMFSNASSFNQDVGDWNVFNVIDLNFFLNDVPLSISNYDSLFIGWSSLTLQNGLTLTANTSRYSSDAQSARQSIIDNFGWTIDDAGLFTIDPFITVWKTDNEGVSNDDQVTIPGKGNNYTIEWEDVKDASVNGSLTEIKDDTTITFPSTGTYRIKITGDFFRIHLGKYDDAEKSDALKLLEIEQWGNLPWTTMKEAFGTISTFPGYGAENLSITATDAPDLVRVGNMEAMFAFAKKMNADINHWNTGNVTNMRALFTGAESFNQNISSWNTSFVTDMSQMFAQARAFNQDIGNWDVSNVTNMSGMFRAAESFNQDISSWDIKNVTRMSGVFFFAESFNQDIGKWNTSNVVVMDGLFSEAISFNQDISDWNTSNVRRMPNMFQNAKSFNQDIADWNTGSVWNMSGMFSGAEAFNQDISEWDVSNVIDMEEMFFNASSFNQDLSNWDITEVGNGPGDFINFLSNSGMSRVNYDYLLQAWSKLSVQTGLSFGAESIRYTSVAESARNKLVDEFNWTINDAGLFVPKPFITVWQTDNEGVSDDDQISILGTGSDYTIEWEDINDASVNGTLTVAEDDTTITFPDSGTFRMKISGNFTRIQLGDFTNQTDAKKLLEIEQWGDIQWITMDDAFRDAENMTLEATDVPDLSQVDDLDNMFWGAAALNGNISDWDVSTVNSMKGMFNQAESFNQDISSWDVSNVANMSSMFSGANAFNQDISNWDVSSVTKMRFMFNGADAFNQDISTWDVSGVTNMDFMFNRAKSFNQDISSWDVSNVTDMDFMFEFATNFDQNLGDWNVSNVENFEGFFGDPEFSTNDNPFLSSQNYDSLLIGWAQLDLKPDIAFDAPNAAYSEDAASARKAIEDNFNWTFNDEGLIDRGTFPAGETTTADLPGARVTISITNRSNNAIALDVRDRPFIVTGNIETGIDTVFTDLAGWVINIASGQENPDFEATINFPTGGLGNFVDTEKLTIVKRADTSQAWQDVTSLEAAVSFNASENTLTVKGINSFSEFALALSETATANEEDISEIIPTEFDLKQNYPNPFNPSTTITYDMPASGQVRLSVYNSLGQRVATLVNERQAAGRHQVSFDAQNLASGLYLYRIEANTKIITRKMLLVK